MTSLCLSVKRDLMFLVMIGPPGAGKGTQAKRLAETLGLSHVSTGEIFRQNISRKTELGLRVKELLEDGILVPDDLTIELVQDQIDQLAQAVGFRYEYDAETEDYIHASGIVVATPQGKLARYFYGIEFAPKDLRLGLIEATNGQIGNPVDQLLLLCFNYDPQSGKYNLVVMNTLRVAGFATLAVMGSFIVVMVRRDRRKKTNEV